MSGYDALLKCIKDRQTRDVIDEVITNLLIVCADRPEAAKALALGIGKPAVMMVPPERPSKGKGVVRFTLGGEFFPEVDDVLGTNRENNPEGWAAVDALFQRT